MRVMLWLLVALMFSGVAGASVTTQDPITRIDEASSLDIADTRHSYIEMYDQSHSNVLPGGQVSFLDAFDSSTVEISGGSVSHLGVYGGSTVEVSTGSVSHLSMYGDSRAQIDGGELSFLGVFDNSAAAIRHGEIAYLLLSDTAAADIYGRDFRLRNGIFSGQWADGTAFEFWLVSQRSATELGQILYTVPSNLMLHVLTSSAVPLPAGIGLLVIGLIWLGVARARQGLLTTTAEGRDHGLQSGGSGPHRVGKVRTITKAKRGMAIA